MVRITNLPAVNWTITTIYSADNEICFTDLQLLRKWITLESVLRGGIAVNSAEQRLHLNISYIDAITAAYSTLNSTQKRIADVILKNGARCRHLSAREVAEECGCGSATVVRFARKLNYEGFTDLKFHIRNAASDAPVDDITLSSGEKTESMKQKALMYAALSLRATVERVDENALDHAARAISAASCVQLCATGSAGGVAMTACSQLLSFGIRASFPSDELQQLRSAACLRPGDVLIGINYNNSAKSVTDAFMTAKKAGAATILITAVKGGIISRYADLVFYTPARQPNNSLNISTTALCQSMIVQLLILRAWQLNPALFEKETERIRAYTKMKLYDPALEKITVTYSGQSR